MTFYTGIPVGNVAAVRKSFLDTYPGEVVILEAGPFYNWLTWDEIRTEAAKVGLTYTDEQMWQVESRLTTRLVRESLVGKVAEIWPPLEPPPPFAAALLERQRQATRRGVAEWIANDGNPMLWGYSIERYADWWPIFFYRFVDPQRRSGERLNYANRVREAHATVLPQQWVVYHCPPRPTGLPASNSTQVHNPPPADQPGASGPE
jgi:hypothetical protein